MNMEMWRHFMSRCALEVSAALNRCTVAEIGVRTEARCLFEILFAEGFAVAAAHGIKLAGEIEPYAVLSKSAGSASRLRADFDKGLAMEVETFAGDMVRLGKEKGVAVAAFEEGYGELLALVKG